MLQHENSARFKQIAIENKLWQLAQFFQSIGRVSKNKIELLMATLDKMEHIAFYQYAVGLANPLHTFADKARMVTVGFHTHDRFTSS